MNTDETNKLRALPGRSADALTLIGAENLEQIMKHGFTAERDDQLVNGELAHLAMYALSPYFKFPANIDPKFQETIRDKSAVEQLIVAGACIVAEINRRLRLEAKAMSIRDEDEPPVGEIQP